MGPDAMILVFWLLSFKPAFSLSSLAFIKKLFSFFSLPAIRVVSSACLKLLIFLSTILILAFSSSSPAFHMMYFACNLNKQGEKIQTSCAPFPIWNQSIVPYPVLAADSWPAHRFLRRQVRWSGIPFSLRIFHSLLLSLVKCFGIINKAEVDIFLELSCFSYDAMDVGKLISSSSVFSKSILNITMFHGSCAVEACIGEFWTLLC